MTQAGYRPEDDPRYLPPDDEDPDPADEAVRAAAARQLDTVVAVLDMMEAPGWAHFAATISAHMLEAQHKALNATDILAVAEARGQARECNWILHLQASQLVERDRLTEATQAEVLDEPGEEREHAT